jgi:hypothetical protein
MITRTMRWILTVLAVLALSACVGAYAKPKTLDQSLLYAQGQVLAAYQTLEDVVDRGKISKATALKRKATIDKADDAVKTARLAFDENNLPVAQRSLHIALALLLQLEALNE